jgi:hypothetical protein
MKIDKYKKFLKENVKRDEDSHLNDILHNRWDDSTYDPYIDEEDSDNNNDYGNDNIQDLLDVLRKLFMNSGLYNVEIENSKRDIIISIELRNRERLRDIIKLFEVVNGLKVDILPQYDSEFDMWETKEGAPIFAFSFYYNSI